MAFGDASIALSAEIANALEKYEAQLAEEAKGEDDGADGEDAE